MVLSGDLSKPRLGLSDRQFQDLARKTQRIYHLGALVNFVYPYSVMRRTNVNGMQEILRLATTGCLKPVHFCSTLSVLFGDQQRTDIVKESEVNPEPERITTGYGQSKWVAEQLALAGMERGIPVTIYRPGRITGDSRSGAWADGDLLAGLLATVIQFGSAPDWNAHLDLTPVDFVARSLLEISLHADSAGEIFHLINNRLIAWQEVIRCLNESGYSIKRMEPKQWFSRLPLGTEVDVQRLMAMFQPFTGAQLQGPSPREFKLRFDCHRADTRLQGSDVICPAADKALLLTYFDHLRRVGTFPLPESR